MKKWSDDENKYLEFNWGALSPRVIAKNLGRTHSAVYQHARRLGLGHTSRGTLTVEAFSRETGYHKTTIRNAIKALGRQVQKNYRNDPTGGSSSTTRLSRIDIDLQEEVLELLASADRFYTNKPGLGKTTKGVWGIGKKPTQCIDCGENERPHYSKGLCRRCYDRKRNGKKVQGQKAQEDPKF